MQSIMYLQCNLLLIAILIAVYEITAQDETLSTSTDVEYSDISDNDDEFTKLCWAYNLRVATPIVDSKMKTIAIDFKPTKPEFLACFPYFNIYLKQKEREIDKGRAIFDYIKMKASYTFEDVACGSYTIVIVPCVKNWRCTQMYIKFPGLVNMTSIECENKTPSMLKSTIPPFHEPENLILITVIFLSIALVMTASILTYRRYHLGRMKDKIKLDVSCENGIVKLEANQNDTEINQVYLLHYYDNLVENNAELLKDFLLKSSYFRVTQIEDALPEILMDKDRWVNEVLKIGQSYEKSNKKKIIIVNSERPGSVDVNEIENEAFYELMKKLQRNWEKSRNNYENIFVVHFNNSFAELEELKHISERDRYSIPDYLVDLCLNLIAGSGTVMFETEKQLQQLLAQHPIRQLKS